MVLEILPFEFLPLVFHAKGCDHGTRRVLYDRHSADIWDVDHLMDRAAELFGEFRVLVDVIDRDIDHVVRRRRIFTEPFRIDLVQPASRAVTAGAEFPVIHAGSRVAALKGPSKYRLVKG